MTVSFPRARDLSPRTRDLVCNGIGPARGRSWCANLAWLVSLVLLAGLQRWRELYRQAGNDHDLHYALGGSKRDKRLADGIFISQLIDLAGNLPAARRPLGWLIAGAFYVAVSVGGWWSFTWRKAGPVSVAQLERELEAA